MWRVACVAALIAGELAHSAPGPKDKSAGYQSKADAATWDWTEDRAALDYSVRQSPVPATISVNPAGQTTVTLAVDEKRTVVFDAHQGTPFVVRGKTLYYADFGPNSTGCAVIAVDLDSGKQVWRAALNGLGPIKHFKYRNQVTLDADDVAVRVVGKESSGRYVEYVDRETGRSVAHKVFPED